jgi:hypothetical protein
MSGANAMNARDDTEFRFFGIFDLDQGEDRLVTYLNFDEVSGPSAALRRAASYEFLRLHPQVTASLQSERST